MNKVNKVHDNINFFLLFFLIWKFLFFFNIVVWDYTTGRVGAPLVCCEIKLMNWEEGEKFFM